MKNKFHLQAAFFGLMGTFATSALAQAMPWEGPICKIAKSFSGPVAVSFVVLAVVLCGSMLAFGELNGIFKTLLGVAIGGAMAVGAVQWTTIFTGGSFACNSFGSVEMGTKVVEAVMPVINTLTSLV